MNILRENCPLCGGINIRLHMVCEDRLGFGEEFSLYVCDACSFIFTNPAPKPEDIWRYYETGDYGPLSETVRNPVDRFAHVIRMFTVPARCRMVQKQCGKRKGSLLEIGAGTGVFSSAMTKRGWDVFATEPSQTARDQAKRLYGLSLHDVDALSDMNGRTFDVVVLWQVLEHVSDIHETMNTVGQYLSHDGIAVIAVPNHTCFDAEYYGSRWNGYDVPIHYSHFTEKTLSKLADMHGLTVTKAFGLRGVSEYMSIMTEYVYKGSILRGLIIGLIADIQGMFLRRRNGNIVYILRHPKRTLS